MECSFEKKPQNISEKCSVIPMIIFVSMREPAKWRLKAIHLLHACLKHSVCSLSWIWAYAFLLLFKCADCLTIRKHHTGNVADVVCLSLEDPSEHQTFLVCTLPPQLQATFPVNKRDNYRHFEYISNLKKRLKLVVHVGLLLCLGQFCTWFYFTYCAIIWNISYNHDCRSCFFFFAIMKIGCILQRVY